MAYKYKLVQEIKDLNPVLKNIEKTDLDTNPEQDKEHRAKGNTYMTPEEREERKKQCKKNLAKEVLNKLKNR